MIKNLYRSIFIFLFLSSCTSIPTSTDTLSLIISEQVLKVGTTLDYPPFSYVNTKGEVSGIDIDLAKALAKSLNVEVIFVKTSWKNLSKDLLTKKFHIALSGISRTQKRMNEGIQGMGHIQNGKLAISRCGEREMYPTLASINKPNVRVVYNPGGTNEAFAKKMVPNSKLTLHENNKTIFNEILNGNVDIMLTDSVEVLYQSKIHKGKLCPTMAKNLTKGVITYFGQKSQTLKVFLDQWFKSIESSGIKKEIFKKYL
jgi:cyclohexadienyl dehydratase